MAELGFPEPGSLHASCMLTHLKATESSLRLLVTPVFFHAREQVKISAVKKAYEQIHCEESRKRTVTLGNVIN